MNTTPISDHEGKKYVRQIKDVAWTPTNQLTVNADVYAIIDAHEITCPAQGHALKKVLHAGCRGKGSKIDDLQGAIAALNRAIELELIREALIQEGINVLQDLDVLGRGWTGVPSVPHDGNPNT